MSGRMIEFSGNGKPFSGYLAPAAGGTGPGVIVIQEWWGLVGHIRDVADRLAAAGFTALAPDFFHGKQTAEPDEAGSLMMALDIDNAEKVIQGAVSRLLEDDATTGEKVGVIGFCMGGQLSLYAACINDRIGACSDFYGIHPNVKPPLQDLHCPLLGIFAEHDEYASPEAVSVLDAELTRLEKDHRFHTYKGVHHAFFNSDRPEVYDPAAAEDAWEKVLAFFKANL